MSCAKLGRQMIRSALSSSWGGGAWRRGSASRKPAILTAAVRLLEWVVVEDAVGQDLVEALPTYPQEVNYSGWPVHTVIFSTYTVIFSAPLTDVVYIILDIIIIGPLGQNGNSGGSWYHALVAVDCHA